MATSNIQYCTHRDIKDTYPAINDSGDAKRPIYGWVTTGTSNLYLARDTGLVTQLFADGEDLGDAEANSGVVDTMENGIIILILILFIILINQLIQ